MSPEAQRIAIAKAVGGVSTCFHDRGVFEFRTKDNRLFGDLLSDINAMREVAEILKGTPASVEFVTQLRVIIERTDDLRTVHWFAVVHATAAQRAEAFLRAIGKWEAGK